MLRRTTFESGVVEGLPAADPRITSFKGIPFAAAPVGPLRWKAPQPAPRWEGVLQAYQYGPIAMQATPGLDADNLYSREWHVDPSIPMNEDCLQLNVWTPARSTKEKLPVMVWIYGGGLQVGYPSEMEFDGERIARRGVVLVSLNYRLNVFGFLAHPALTAEDRTHATNFGHWDQRFGMEWVKRNIQAFGGDPQNITIFGQSAGGGSTMIQVASPLNEGLFQRAIVHSGGGLLPPGLNSPTLEEAESLGEQFLQFLGVKTIDEARELDADTLYKKAEGFYATARWGSVIDGVLIPDFPAYRLAENRRNQVEILMGHTDNEFFVHPEAATEEEFVSIAKRWFGGDAERYLDICRKDADSLPEMIRNGTYNRFEMGDLLWGELNATNDGPPMYGYVFHPEIPGPDAPGAFHSSDLWFAFETLAKCWRPFVGKHYDLARQMCNYWTNFAKTGDPNGQDADGAPMPQWLPYCGESPYLMDFGDVPAMNNKDCSELTTFLMAFFKKKIKNRKLQGYFVF